MQNNNYSISEVSHEEFTNSNIVVEFKPKSNVAFYSYTIIKNNVEVNTFTKGGIDSNGNIIRNQSSSEVVFSTTGQYVLEFTLYDDEAKIIETVRTGVYNVDKDAPIIKIDKDSYQIELGSKYDFLEGVTATDNIDGNISSQVAVTKQRDDDFSKTGKKIVTYRVTDSSGNVTSKSVTFEVVENARREAFMKDCTFIGILCIVLIVIFKYYHSIAIERRIAKFSLEPKARSKSIFDRMIELKKGVVSTLAKSLGKYPIIYRYGEKYEKYQVAFGAETSTEIIAEKVLMSLIFLILSIFAATLRLELVSLPMMLASLLLGYISVDLIYAIKYRFYRNHVENDLLQAIVIMNNAFRAGKSIKQAIELVGVELDGDIAYEFRRVEKELSMGISVEKAFSNLADRVEIPEIRYLTASLTIINSTGGNIIRVFQTIEKTLMNKKKLRLELKALTGSARMISYLLMVLPAILVSIVWLVSPTYFLPLISSPLGILLIILIVAIYGLYIFLVRYVMKVRM